MGSRLWIIMLFLGVGSWSARAVAEEPTEGPDASGEIRYRQLAAAMGREDVRYRRGETLHRVGSVVFVAGLASVYAGSRLSSWPEKLGGDLGTTLGFAGTALYCIGPALSSAGALHAAGALRRRGAPVHRTFGFVGVGLLGATAALSPLIVHAFVGEPESAWAVLGGGVGSLLPAAAFVSSWVQVRVNRRSLPGIRGLAVLPTPTRRGGGMAVHGSF